MSIQEKITSMKADFAKLPDWEARYRLLVQMGKELPPMPEDLKNEEIKVKGCQSQVWIFARKNSEGGIEFIADSDALIVRGLVALLLKIYSQARPEEILNTPVDFIEELGFKNHLSPSRANGLYAMIRQMYYYAAAFS